MFALRLRTLKCETVLRVAADEVAARPQGLSAHRRGVDAAQRETQHGTQNVLRT